MRTVLEHMGPLFKRILRKKILVETKFLQPFLFSCNVENREKNKTELENSHEYDFLCRGPVDSPSWYFK